MLGKQSVKEYSDIDLENYYDRNIDILLDESYVDVEMETIPQFALKVLEKEIEVETENTIKKTTTTLTTNENVNAKGKEKKKEEEEKPKAIGVDFSVFMKHCQNLYLSTVYDVYPFSKNYYKSRLLNSNKSFSLKFNNQLVNDNLFSNLNYADF